MWQQVVSFFLYLCAVVGAVCYGRVTLATVRVFIGWIWIWATADILLYLFYDYMPNGRLLRIIYCILDPLQYLVYAYVFVLAPYSNSKLKALIWSMFGLFFAYALWQLYFHIDQRSIITDSFLIKSALCLLIVLYYFGDIIVSNKVLKISTNALFWIATASLFYFAGNIIATGLFHQLLADSKQLAQALYKLNYILEIVMYLFSILAFILASTKK